jgi:hypothetical protein
MRQGHRLPFPEPRLHVYATRGVGQRRHAESAPHEKPSLSGDLDVPLPLSGYREYVNHHNCEPPTVRPPFEMSAWTCPECGDAWVREPYLPPDAAQSDVETEQAVVQVVWTRIGQPDD